MTTTTDGWQKTAADDQHPWDTERHVVYDAVPVTELELWDVLAQTLQIEGMAVAEHRGKPAIRLDVNNVAAGGKGRIVLTTDQVVSDVKRYADGGPAPSVAQVLTSRVSGQREASTGLYDWEAVARAWCDAEAGGDDGPHETHEQRLFGFLCAGVEAYSELLLRERGPGEVGAAELEQENAYTLQSIAENIAPSHVAGSTVSSDVAHQRRAALCGQIRSLLEDAHATSRPETGDRAEFFAAYHDRVDDLLTRSERELRGR